MSDRVTFTFSQVDAVLATMNFIAEHKRAAFTARIKQLLKHDFLDESAPGRGRAGSYSILALLQLVVAVEFLQSGMAPPLAAATVAKNKFRLHQALLRGVFNIGFDKPPADSAFARDSLIMVYCPEALRELVAEGERPAPTYFTSVPSRHMDLSSTILEDRLGRIASWRRLLLNLTTIVQSTYNVITSRFRFATQEAFIEDVLADVDEMLVTVQEVHELTVGQLDDELMAEAVDLPTEEPEYLHFGLPGAAILMSEWDAAGLAVFAKHEAKVKRFLKAVGTGPISSALDHGKPIAHLGLFRIDGRTLKLTRLGRAVLDRHFNNRKTL